MCVINGCVRDMAPEGRTLEESNRNLDEITDLALELQKKTGVKVLWVTCNLFAHPRSVTRTAKAAKTSRAMALRAVLMFW